MEAQIKDEGEDIPSDFFDDFNKAEFIEGLSVIDSWDDNLNNPRPRIDTEAVESVKDLRELIRDGKPEKNTTDREHHSSSQRSRRSRSRELADLIKPGSRRDPSKTNEAIRRDKDAKVKEFLAKSLESSDDIRPPGTELDDFFEGSKPLRKEEKSKRSRSPVARNKSRERRRRESPRKSRASPPPRRRESPPRRRESPPRHRESPPHRRESSPRRRESPLRRRESPLRRRESPQRRSPARYPSTAQKRSLFTFRRSSPGRRSPRRSPRRQRPSRSPYRRSPNRRSPNYRRSHSHSRSRSPKDSFLYPVSRSKARSDLHYPHTSQPNWDPSTIPLPGDFVPPPGYYPNAGPPAGVGYPGYGGAPMGFDYGPQVVAPPLAPPIGYVPPVGPPLPVPAPVPPPVAGPPMVPAPQLPSPTLAASSVETTVSKKTPYDALGQLLADGKISKEDYLKLTPNKGANIPGPMDLKEKVELLSRCHNAVSKLAKLHLPNRLIMHNNMTGPEPKTITPKFCSPLKRQPAVEFHFTQVARTSAAQQNKQLVDSIIATIGLDKIVPRLKKKEPKNMKDAAVQTMKPHCDICTIREATKFYDAGTTIDPEHFSSSAHTQVLEQDLASSRAVFNPSGAASDSAPISIAHLTPAQLVSQLAARAKTLQTQPASDPNQYQRRNPNSYDYDNRGGNQYQNNSYNYRY